MCYADGGGKAMQQICPNDQESLFDCNNDDYYSTFPPAGSYLATHWNTADSRFLIGGGDGSGGGSLGVPTTARRHDDGQQPRRSPACRPRPRSTSRSRRVGPRPSPGPRTRKDCVFAAPAAVQTTVTCDAKTATAGHRHCDRHDSTGAKLGAHHAAHVLDLAPYGDAHAASSTAPLPRRTPRARAARAC